MIVREIYATLTVYLILDHLIEIKANACIDLSLISYNLSVCTFPVEWLAFTFRALCL